MKLKKIVKLLLHKSIAVVLCLLLFSGCALQSVPATQSTASLSENAAVKSQQQEEKSTVKEETFFGKWSNGYWKVVPKLDYTYSALSDVEKYAKLGDYESAKDALLSYYKRRDTVSGLSPTANTSIAADLLLQNIIAWDYGDYISYTTVSAQLDWYSFNVLGGISLGQQVGIELVARGKRDDLAVFDSREGENVPYLELTVNGTPVVLYPQKDVTVRAGAYRSVAYGTQNTLEVNDTGYPADDNSRRAIFVFDLSDLTGIVTAANLRVYGKTTESNVEIMAVKHADIAWSEDTLTYANANLRLFSWEGNMSAWDWGPPDGCTVQFDLTTLTMKFVDNLLRAYHSTQRADYAEKAIEMLVCVSLAGGDEPRLGDPLRTGSRGDSMTNQFAYLVKTPHMTAEDCFDIVYYMWIQGEFLGDPLLEYPKYSNDINYASYTPISNWGVTQTAGLYCLSHYFYELSGASEWQALSVSRIDDILASLINVDGSYNEDCTSYVTVTLNSFLNIVKLAQLNGFALTQGTVLRIMNCLEYVMAYSMPNGLDPNYGDASVADTTAVISSYIDIFGDEGSLLYYASRGNSGTAPDFDSTYYPSNNWAILRSGWDEDDLYMHINTQSGTHNHWDSNAVIMYAYGRNLLIDSGRKSYDDSDPDTLWQRKNVESHNTLQVDNTSGRAAGFVNEVRGFDTTGLADFYQGYNEQASADTGHTRTVFMIKDGFYIVSDYVENKADKVRTYSLNWHLPVSSNPIVTTQKTATQFGTGANLQIIPSVSDCTVQLKEGVLTQYAVGEAIPYPYVKYSYSSKENLNVSTLLYPTREGETQDVSMQAIPLSVTNNLAQAMRIDFDGTRGNHTAYYYLSNETQPNARSYETFYTNGSLAYTEYDSEGNLVRIVFSGGSTLSQDGSDLLSSPERLGFTAMAFDGNILTLQGNLVPCTDRSQAIKIYAPNIAKVTVNGETVEFERDGDYIYAARSSESEEIAAVNNTIAALPAIENLTYEDRDTVALARYAVDMCTAKGFSPDAEAVEHLVKLESRIALLTELREIEQDVRLLMPYGVTLETSNTLQSLISQLASCAEQYENATEVAEYIALKDQLDAYVEETAQLAVAVLDKTYISKYPLLDSARESYNMEQVSAGSGQGYNGFYYYYLRKNSTEALQMDTTGHHSTNLTDVYYTVNGASGVHWGPEGVSSTTTVYAMCGWRAEEACTVKLDLSVYATAYMSNGGDGAYVLVSVGTELSGYPFNKDLSDSSSVIYKEYIDKSANSASNPVEYQQVFTLEAGQIIWIGISPNVTSSYDVLIVDAQISKLNGAQPVEGVTAEEAFAAVDRIQNTLFAMPDPEDVTLNDGNWIAQMESDLALFDDASKFYLYDKYCEVKAAYTALGASISNDLFAITPIASAGGTVYVDKSFAAPGSLVSIELVAEEGYKPVMSEILVNGSPVDSLNFIMPSSDVTITAQFERVSYSIDAAEQSHATLRLSSDNAAVGDKVFYAFDVDYGYQIREGSVKLNGETLTENWFVMPAQQVVITYEVEKIQLGGTPVVGIVLGSVGGAVVVSAGIAAAVILLKRRKAK